MGLLRRIVGTATGTAKKASKTPPRKRRRGTKKPTKGRNVKVKL
jgi:hypothetical protein